LVHEAERTRYAEIKAAEKTKLRIDLAAHMIKLSFKLA
jgi:hypothetical protein